MLHPLCSKKELSGSFVCKITWVIRKHFDLSQGASRRTEGKPALFLAEYAYVLNTL